METEDIEKVIKSFLKDGLMKEEAEHISNDDELMLDSLDQTELRVFLTEQYSINTDLEKAPADKIETINDIIKLVRTKTQTQNVS